MYIDSVYYHANITSLLIVIILAIFTLGSALSIDCLYMYIYLASGTLIILLTVHIYIQYIYLTCASVYQLSQISTIRLGLVIDMHVINENLSMIYGIMHVAPEIILT